MTFTSPRDFCRIAIGALKCFSDRSKRVAEVIESLLADEGRAALETALRYCKEAAPKHTADEEESLFPRLRQIHHRDVESALAALNALEDEHRRADALHAEVHALGLRCLGQGRLPLQEAGRFRQAVRDLVVIYGEHIRIEDDVVFPAARRALSGPQKSAIANEMAFRRELDLQARKP